MGNSVNASRFVLVLSLVVFAVLGSFSSASAASSRDTSMTQQLKERLCARQSALGSRLARALIDPALCNPVQPTPTLTLTATPSTISSGATSVLAWTSSNVTSCTASNGWSGAKALSGSEIVSPSATTTYALNCTGSNGSISKSVTVNVTPTTPDTPTLTLTATPTTVQAGGNSSLAWTSTNASVCTATGGWTGSKALSGNESVTVSATTTYILSCTGAGGSIQKEVTVNTTPQPTPTISLSADPLSVQANGTSTLTWSSTNTTLCVASNGWTGDKATSGTESVSPSATSTYALSCGGAFGTTSASVTVNVTPNPVVTVSLTANPTSVTPGAGTATTTLTWGSSGATSCTAFGGWTGSKALSGSEVVTPSATTTYQLDCTGPGGVGSDDAVVNFVPTSSPGATLTFTANPTSVTPGAGSASSTLTWSSTNATLCTASNGWSGSQALSGGLVVTPVATTTYTLDCGNAVGTSTQSVTIDFVPTPAQIIGHMVISEVHYDVASSTVNGNDSSYEWIELYNGTGSAVDLQGWFVGDASSTDMIDDSVVVQPGGFVIIAASSTPAGVPGGVPVIVLSSSIGLNGFSNGGDGAVLRDTASALIDSVGFGTNATVAPNVSIPGTTDGHSISRTQLVSDTDTSTDWADTAVPTPGTN
ncbi:MAG: lamin tail domain-containing protein [Minisyncoccia bacterium]